MVRQVRPTTSECEWALVMGTGSPWCRPMVLFRGLPTQSTLSGREDFRDIKGTTGKE